MAETTNGAGRAPKHGRHMSAASGAAPERQLGTPLSESNRSSLHMKLPQEGQGADATSAWIPSDNESESPRPIGVDPAATGSFERLSVGEGATITTRENAQAGRTAAMAALKVDSHRIDQGGRPKVASRQTQEKHDRRIYVVLAVLAAVLVAAGIFFTRNVLSTQHAQGSAEDVPQSQAGIGQTITYGDGSYALMEQADGSVALTYQAEDSASPQTLCTLAGRPVQLFLYNGTLVIPENLDGRWDVVAYMRGISTEATPVMLGEEPAGGEGSIESAQLDGSTLLLSTSDGAIVSVGLE